MGTYAWNTLYFKILPAKSRGRRRLPAAQSPLSQAVHRNLATGPNKGIPPSIRKSLWIGRWGLKAINNEGWKHCTISVTNTTTSFRAILETPSLETPVLHLNQHIIRNQRDQHNRSRNVVFQSVSELCVFNGWQLAKMKKSIPDMSLP